MTTEGVGRPAGTPTATAEGGTGKPEMPPDEEQTALSDRIAHGGREKSAQLADQAKTKVRHFTDKTRHFTDKTRDFTDKTRTAATQEPKRSWGAAAAAATAVAGIAAGWVIRRRRARRSWWVRLRRLR